MTFTQEEIAAFVSANTGAHPLDFDQRRALDIITHLQQRVQQYQERLEIDGAWQSVSGAEPVRIVIPDAERDTFPDGIMCRNETIKLQDERIARLQQREKALTEALKSSVICMEECQNIIRPTLPSFAKGVMGEHISLARAALNPEQKS